MFGQQVYPIASSRKQAYLVVQRQPGQDGDRTMLPQPTCTQIAQLIRRSLLLVTVFNSTRWLFNCSDTPEVRSRNSIRKDSRSGGNDKTRCKPRSVRINKNLALIRNRFCYAELRTVHRSMEKIQTSYMHTDM